MTEEWRTNSWSSPSCFAAKSIVVKVTPVILPPGRLRLATKPVLTGSLPVTNRIGVVIVAALAACTTKTVFPTINATCRAADRPQAPAADPDDHLRSDTRSPRFDLRQIRSRLDPAGMRLQDAQSQKPSSFGETRSPASRLLRPRRERPRGRRAAEQRDELAPLYPNHVIPRAYAVWVRLKRTLEALAHFARCLGRHRPLPPTGRRAR